MKTVNEELLYPFQELNFQFWMLRRREQFNKLCTIRPIRSL